MKRIKAILKKALPAAITKLPGKIRTLVYRIRSSTRYYNRKYLQILQWLFNSEEISNYTYDITDANVTCLAQTITLVTNRPFTEIKAYIEEVRNNTELKKHILHVAEQRNLERVKKEVNSFGRRMGWYAIARAIKPSLIVETGVERGHGALILNFALSKNAEEGFEGRYLGTDIDPGAGGLFTGKYTTRGKILYGDSIESLRGISEPIDLFINDSDHSSEYEAREYEIIQSKLSGSAIILGDNAHDTDKLSQFSVKTGRNFIFFREVPKNHWYPGGGIGISFKSA